MQKNKFILFMIFFLFTQDLHASDIGNDLMDFFKRAGMVSNATAPMVYKDQSAGYYSGGSVSTRNSVKNAQLATIQMPGFRAGCGGIDLWMGVCPILRENS